MLKTITIVLTEHLNKAYSTFIDTVSHVHHKSDTYFEFYFVGSEWEAEWRGSQWYVSPK